MADMLPNSTKMEDRLTYHIKLTAGVLLSDLIFLGGRLSSYFHAIARLILIALIMALAYTYAQDKRGGKVTFYVIQIPVIFLPWAMLALTLVMGGWPMALRQGTGLVAAHAYEFLTRIYPGFGGGRNWIQTPAMVRRWFGGDQRTQTTRGFGTAYRPAAQPQSQTSGGGWSSGLSSVWNSRGQGRRLGGD